MILDMPVPEDHWSRRRLFPSTLPVHVLFARHDVDVPAHDHDFVEIALVVSGQAVHHTRQGSEPLGCGDVITLRPGVWHGYGQPRKLRIWNCCFGPELLQRELAWTLEDPILNTVLWGLRDQTGGAVRCAIERQGIGPCRQRLQDLLGLAQHSHPGQATAVGLLLVYLDTLAHYVRKNAATTLRPLPPKVIAAIRMLEGDLVRAWCMADLAKATGIDPAYLTRQFTSAVGTSPMAYLFRRRAEHAAALLLQTQQPIGAIATAVGWEDPVYFARRFRQHYGMSATAYRRRHAPFPHKYPPVRSA